jgi:hypothetical protein
MNEEERKQLHKAIVKASKGDRAALATIKAMLPKGPDAALFWERLGNLALDIEKLWTMNIVSDSDLVVIEGIRHKLAAMRRELAGPDPAPLERLLADRITLCWLQMQYAEARLAQKTRDGTGLEWAEYYQRQAERAQRRYLAAIKALATVRRLLTPAVQVNIGGQQVNVAGPVYGGGGSQTQEPSE